MLPQGGAIGKWYRQDNPNDLALENINNEDPLILHDEAKSPMPSNNTYLSHPNFYLMIVQLNHLVQKLGFTKNLK